MGGLASACAPAATPTPTPPPAVLAAVEGATPEERALNGIKALKEAGKIKDSDTFTIMHHSGQRNNIVSAFEEWNSLTGLNFQSAEVGLESDIYTKAMNEAVVRTGDFDIFLTFCNWIGDMAEAGLIVDQTDWWTKYDPEVDHGPNAFVPPLDRFTSLYKGRRYALGADDAFSLFYRKDIMEAADKAAFEDKYGRELALPNTWEEFDQWIEFFDRPDEGFRGATCTRSGISLTPPGQPVSSSKGVLASTTTWIPSSSPTRGGRLGGADPAHSEPYVRRCGHR